MRVPTSGHLRRVTAVIIVARLAHTEDSIDEITHHVGWQDQTHFVRQFRKTYGPTPAAWRRQHRAQHVGDVE
ncbi:MAG: AraC family transcriptional regulator [Proteobacteria bacterium]|nr:MAG: AraC family transcriptional regulator [Pseudomonadota bacterium]